MNVFLTLLTVLQDSLCTVNFRVKVPYFTPNSDIYFASNYNGWNPCNDAFKLVKEDTGVFSLSVSLPRGFPLEYKFTRGSWLTVEKGVKGEEIPNRTLVVLQDTTIEIEVANWRDFLENERKSHNISGNVEKIEFKSRILRYYNPRKVWIYLPPDYEVSNKRYPVLYMQDGQNLFDDSESYAGEWHVDEILEEMYKEKGFSLIVVGIENAQEYRIDEYSPYFNEKYSRGGGGKLYVDFVVKELKPFIDQNYHTEPQITGILGSSLGGLISIYAGFLYPEIFKIVGSMSGAFWFNPEIKDFISRSEVCPQRVYLDWGLKESENPDFYVKGNREILGTLKNRFGQRIEFKWVEDPEGIHHESSWSKRFRSAVEFLFK